MDWDKLRVFYVVAQEQSLTRAGQTLSLSQSAVSRQISGLEEKLKTSLFHRHARGLLLTEQGEILYRSVGEMVTKLQITENMLAESASKPRGPFCVTAPTSIGTVWLAPLLREFCQLYPDIDVTLLVDDRELDLSKREADVAIRMYPSKHPDLIQKQIIKLGNGIYASNDYLRERGIPQTIDELTDHTIIGFTEHKHYSPFPHVNWLYERDDARSLGIKPSVRMNSLNAIRAAMKIGHGLAPLPDYMVYRARHISRVLPNISGPSTETYYVYPIELKNSRRVAVFRSFIERKISEYKF